MTVYDVGTDALAAYIVSEAIEGRTLREVLEGGALPVGTAIPYAVQIAQGLAAAHERDVVHRDLTPENMLISPDGCVKIIGFGLAAATQSESGLDRGGSSGAPGYMSPEQARGEPADQRSDMFAFDAIFYEMLAGTRAFSGGTPVDVKTAVLESAPPLPPAPDLPPVVARIVELSLKKSPGSRVSASDVVIALQGFWSQPVSPDAVEAPVSSRRTGRLVRVAAVLGVMGLAALAGPWLLRVVRPAGTSTSTAPEAAPPALPPPLATLPATAPAPTPPVSAPAAPLPAVRTPSAPTVSGPSTPPSPARTPSAPIRAAAGPQQSQLVWFDRTGTELGRIGEPADYGDVSLSPDGARVAVSVRERGSEAADIWVFEIASGMGTRVTSDPADDIAPVWSPDGRRILFASSRGGSYDIYERALGGTGNEVAIINAPGDQIADDWSSDGRHLVYQTSQPGATAGGNLDLWARLLPGGRPFAFLRTIHAASRASLSPDGSSVAYTSLEGGRDDVYVARFPRYEGRRRISAGGGSWPRWLGDGGAIVYLDLGNRLVAVPMEGTGKDVDAGPARPLFQTRPKPNRGYPYDVSADGQRLLVNLSP